ncbi:hypothetical protein HanIR_Chr17g0865981 [Helianthus annuus]|nr:hypothetical protein HanIR_Chr17g0865981 [Helianthus annuus]
MINGGGFSNLSKLWMEWQRVFYHTKGFVNLISSWQQDKCWFDLSSKRVCRGGVAIVDAGTT